MSRNPSVSAAAAALVLACAAAAPGQPHELTSELIASGLSRPVFATSPPGDMQRLFIVEQRGSGGESDRGDIRIVDLATRTLLPGPFLSIAGLATGPEQGLLGLAFAPDYAQSGRFYIYYTADGPQGGTSRLVRYRVSGDPNVADPTSAEALLSIPQPFANHNGGWLEFGPDGYLYLSLGDGGSGGDPQNHAQNVNTLLGTILRIDVSGPGEYTIPPDNPFAGGGGRPEIWAYGLRNPWRNSFDRASGDLWIADVGQGDWEEINFQPASGSPPHIARNYGWRCYEGTEPFNLSACPHPSAIVFPVHTYSIRNQPHCAVTGGYIYRGAAAPAAHGTYFFADFCSARIWSFIPASGAVTSLRDRTLELAPRDGPGITLISSFGEDAGGELYIISLAGNIFRMIPRCYANCDGAATEPILTVDDFTCFINRFVEAQSLPVEEQINHYANCDGSTRAPVLSIVDFVCFIREFVAGCP